jgi:hypothetical protein
VLLRLWSANLDCPHYPQLLKRQFMPPAVFCAVLPKNAGQLKS